MRTKRRDRQTDRQRERERAINRPQNTMKTKGPNECVIVHVCLYNVSTSMTVFRVRVSVRECMCVCECVRVCCVCMCAFHTILGLSSFRPPSIPPDFFLLYPLLLFPQQLSRDISYFLSLSSSCTPLSLSLHYFLEFSCVIEEGQIASCFETR